ncbi:MAG: MBL fold metallo-hydrolase [Candidatus Omnitrophica bacterium]|nr:MBL fold metallo-hydrolase [Candidatus Omnitrophota bacterium]
MIITILGSGTGIPSIRRNPPCVSMKLGAKNAIFDSGPGTLKNLLQLNVDFLNLDLIFYTHLHLDHVSELAAILFATKIPPTIRQRPLSVYGPAGLKDYYENMRRLYKETVYTDAYTLNIEEMENKKIEMEGFEISTRTMEHHGGSMGYRIATPGGNLAVYSGDTDYCDALVEFAKDADLLMLDCSFPDEMKMKGHLSPKDAGRVARESNAKKLVLVHMYPVCDQYDMAAQCKKEFIGDVLVGEDLMRFELN